jgi:hypothetical protein
MRRYIIRDFRAGLSLRKVLAFTRQGSPGSYSHTIAASALRSTVADPGAVGFAEYASDLEVFAAFIKKSTEVNNPPGGRMLALQHTVVPYRSAVTRARRIRRWQWPGMPSSRACSSGR